MAGGGGTASGAWISWEKRLVRFQDGQWSSFLPGVGNGVGWTCWVQDEKTLYSFDGTNWMNALRGKTGGGISVQYVFDTTTADADPGSGKLRLSQATQNTATAIRADLLDVNRAGEPCGFDQHREGPYPALQRVRSLEMAALHGRGGGKPIGL